MTDHTPNLQALLQKAFEAFDSAEYDRALALYRRAETGYSPEPDTLHHIRYMIAFTHAQAGAHDTARNIYQTLLDQTEDTVKQHRVLHQLAMVERLADHFPAARDYLEQEQALLDALPDERPMERAANLYEQGVLYHLEGQQKEAKRILKQSLRAAEQSDDLISRACALRALGDAYAATDQTCAAEGYYKRSLTYFQQTGDSYGADEVQARLKHLSDSDTTGTA